MKKNKYIYVILSSTHCKVGKLIRFVTKEDYNHASLSLDSKFRKLYSFSRYYKNAPFYAGFAEESPLRYKNNQKYARIKIYQIPVFKNDYKKVVKYIKQMKKYSNNYVYNFFSAATFPLRRKVKINNSYTCIEFVLSVLEDLNIIPTDRFYSFKELSNILEDYLIFEGTSDKVFNSAKSWGNDRFLQKKGILFSFFIVIEMGILLKRLVYRKIE